MTERKRLFVNFYANYCLAVYNKERINLMKICGFLLGGADIVISNLRWNNAHFQRSKDFGKMILIRFFYDHSPI